MSLLYSPLRLGRLTLRNRVVFSAHLTSFADDGLVTDQHVEYYAARARGGTGLIITEEHTVHPSDRPYEKMIRGYSPEVLPGYRRLTAAVHGAGAAVLAQLNHNGGQSSGMYTRQPVPAPSAVADPMFREVPQALPRISIDALVRAYAATAARCIEGGFDGVELQASHSSLIRQFLSGATNRRTDLYADRNRFLLEVIAAVRAAIGDAVLGVRLGGDEMIAAGITLDSAVATARVVEATGAVDYLNTSIGVATETLFLIQASMRVPARYALHIPAALRAAVSLPVVGVGRFKDRTQASKALESGIADLIGVVRGQIADPDWASGGSRTCLSCNQECVGRVGFNRWIGCVVNPSAGRESVVVAPPRRRSRVVVVGGGPGGLQAALTAASRGHAVTLYERSSQLGGAVPLAARVPSRAEFGELTRSLVAAVARAGVSVRTGFALDAAAVTADAPDAVVLATGARPVRPSWATSPRVVDVTDVLSGRVAPWGRVLVYDELGFHQATSVAELLASRGCAVEIATPGMIVGQDLGTTLDLELWTRAAADLGIVGTPDVTVAAMDGDVVTLAHHPTGTVRERTVDWVVSVVQPAPEDSLWRALRGAPFAVHRVGDCLAPRRADAAVREGERVGAAL
ncbi:mycofactocin system FadH/OYE family oxidoreductase 2 [Cryptosporangium phraense]|uniref:Mycofactocin system FadH/OYE family oxidoreductase 2 n=1 Tax=Cryptosporangium phraense TaxID=2593070 RepID=A0A545AMX4_9ACTN|nr:mycofactocin system FadH/OYE family oxidoreductase 2 [Cryptosporangium phraense]TQS42633.1 mycofactocin system FadH/OYE family oxidoreductase 2 [Cryptosporangium phraense]